LGILYVKESRYNRGAKSAEGKKLTINDREGKKKRKKKTNTHFLLGKPSVSGKKEVVRFTSGTVLGLYGEPVRKKRCAGKLQGEKRIAFINCGQQLGGFSTSLFSETKNIGRLKGYCVLRTNGGAHKGTGRARNGGAMVNITSCGGG